MNTVLRIIVPLFIWKTIPPTWNPSLFQPSKLILNYLLLSSNWVTMVALPRFWGSRIATVASLVAGQPTGHKYHLEQSGISLNLQCNHLKKKLHKNKGRFKETMLEHEQKVILKSY